MGNVDAALVFKMQLQEQFYWCWAAVAVSTSLFYDANSKWTQCLLANYQLEQTTCCENGDSLACNQTSELSGALTATGNLSSYTSGPEKFTTIQYQINHGTPLGAVVRWDGDGDHAIMLTGWSTASGADLVNVQDPWYGPSVWSYSALAYDYQGTGNKWVASYFTKS